MRFTVIIAVISSAISCASAQTNAPVDKPHRIRDGSTIERAIPLKQRGMKAVEEEIAWMMKIHKYTPLLSTRDAFVEAIRQIKVEKKKEGHGPQPWSHATLEHGNQWCSYWWLRTPRGRKEIYFDTGIPTSTPGEVVRQESTHAQYMAEAAKSLKLQ